MSVEAEIKERFDAIIAETRKADTDRIAQLTAELAEARDHRGCQMATSHALADAQRRWSTERAAHERTKVRLGQAVAAMAKALDFYDAAGGSTDEVDTNAEEMRAILDDEDSKAAGEYVRELKVTIDDHIAELAILRRLESAVFAGDAAACSPKVPGILTEYLEWSLAKVDARRGKDGGR